MTLKVGDKVRFRKDMAEKISDQGIYLEDSKGVWEVVTTKSEFFHLPIQVGNDEDYWYTTEDCLELVDGTPSTQKACEEILDEYITGWRNYADSNGRMELHQLFIDKGLMTQPKKKKKMIRVEFEEGTGTFRQGYITGDDCITLSDRFYDSSSTVTLQFSGTFTLTEFEVEED